MSITMDKIESIRRLHVLGEPLTSIARTLGCDFRTAKKYSQGYLEGSGLLKKLKPRNTKGSEVFKQAFDLLERNKAERGSVTMKTPTLYAELQKLYGGNCPVSEVTVRRYCREIKTSLGCEEQKCYSRLEHSPGVAQVDFGTTVVLQQGVGEVHIDFLVLCFPDSNTRYFLPVPGQSIECVIEGFERIVQHLGKVPHLCWFDNMSSAVVKVLKRSELGDEKYQHIRIHDDKKHPRILTDMFWTFMGHFGFGAIFCNPGAGWEKGAVEAAVKYIKENFFEPLYSWDGNWDTIQQDALKWCDKLTEEVHYEKGRKIKDLFAEERVVMGSLPRKFTAWQEEEVRVNNYGEAYVGDRLYKLFVSHPRLIARKEPYQITFFGWDRVLPFPTRVPRKHQDRLC